MGAFDDAIAEIIAHPDFGRAATYRPRGGAPFPLRLVPLGGRTGLEVGEIAAALGGAGRSFLVRRRDFADGAPKTGDRVEIDGATWRVITAREGSALADCWSLDCQPA